MTESEYTVERRNFENWSSTWPIAWKIWKWSLQDLKLWHSSKTLSGKVIPQTLPRTATRVWGADITPTSHFLNRFCTVLCGHHLEWKLSTLCFGRLCIPCSGDTFTFMHTHWLLYRRQGVFFGQCSRTGKNYTDICDGNLYQRLMA